MKKSDSTSRITSSIQKLHSASRMLIITFGTNLNGTNSIRKGRIRIHSVRSENTQITVRLGLWSSDIRYFEMHIKHKSITVYSGKAMFREA